MFHAVLGMHHLRHRVFYVSRDDGVLLQIRKLVHVLHRVCEVRDVIEVVLERGQVILESGDLARLVGGVVLGGI